MKLRQSVCCCAIMHRGQKNYGQILDVSLLRPEILSKILQEGVSFAGYTKFHEGFYFLKKNYICSVFLTKLIKVPNICKRYMNSKSATQPCVCGATAQIGARSPQLRFLHHTQFHTHANSVGLLGTSDQLVAEAATYTTNTTNEYPLALAGFENMIPAMKRLQTYALDRRATGIGKKVMLLLLLLLLLLL